MSLMTFFSVVCMNNSYLLKMIDVWQTNFQMQNQKREKQEQHSKLWNKMNVDGAWTERVKKNRAKKITDNKTTSFCCCRTIANKLRLIERNMDMSTCKINMIDCVTHIVIHRAIPNIRKPKKNFSFLHNFNNYIKYHATNRPSNQITAIRMDDCDIFTR